MENQLRGCIMVPMVEHRHSKYKALGSVLSVGVTLESSCSIDNFPLYTIVT
jgi:hypothetical protein